MNTELLNGPRRVQPLRTPQQEVAAANIADPKDYKALYERALKREGILESQIRKLNAQLMNKTPAGFGRSQKRK